MELRPAPEVLQSLLDLTRPVLEERGEWEEVAATARFLRREGTGALRQCRAKSEADGLSAVVDRVATATIAGTMGP